MQSLRSFLCGVYAFVSASILWAMVQSPRLLLHAPGPAWEGNRAAGWVARAFLPGIAVIFGASALTYWRRWRSAKFWALAAASVNVAVPFLMSWVLSQYAVRGAGSFFDNLKITALLLVIGVLGIAAFWNWNPSSDDPKERRPQRVRGDGTNPIVDKLFWVTAFAGYFAGMYWWGRWADAIGLPSENLIPSYIGVFIAELVVVLVHEAGHALSGIAFGMKLRGFIVGPFQWRIRGGRWQFAFRPAEFFATGGATSVVPSDPHQPISREIFMIMAGPLASLVGGLAGFWMVLHAPGHAWAPWWRLLAMFTTISILAFVGNLVPFQTSTSNYSDGAQMYQILSGGPWGDLHKAMRIAGATLVTDLRPRDFDIGAIDRAAAVVDSGPRALLLHLLAYTYYLDTSQPARACHEIDQAETIYDAYAAKVPAELHFHFITDAALQRRDALRARLWWDRGEAKKRTQVSEDYWMARSALAWIEGDLDEARSAWAKADGYLRGMPRTGAYEFDRHRLAALAKTIEGEPVPVPELVG